MADIKILKREPASARPKNIVADQLERESVVVPTVEPEEPAPVATKPAIKILKTQPNVPEFDVPASPQLIKNAVEFYSINAKQPLSEKEALERFVSDQAWAQGNSVSLAKRFADMTTGDEEQQKRAAVLFSEFQKLPNIWEKGGRNPLTAVPETVGQAVVDPLNLLGGLIGGKVAKSVIAKQAAKLAAGETVKNAGRTTAIAKIGSTAATDAAVSGGVNVLQQSAEIEAGLKDKIDPGQVALAAGVGGVTSGAAMGLGEAAGQIGKIKILSRVDDNTLKQAKDKVKPKPVDLPKELKPDVRKQWAAAQPLTAPATELTPAPTPEVQPAIDEVNRVFDATLSWDKKAGGQSTLFLSDYKDNINTLRSYVQANDDYSSVRGAVETDESVIAASKLSGSTPKQLLQRLKDTNVDLVKANSVVTQSLLNIRSLAKQITTGVDEAGVALDANQLMSMRVALKEYSDFTKEAIGDLYATKTEAGRLLRASRLNAPDLKAEQFKQKQIEQLLTDPNLAKNMDEFASYVTAIGDNNPEAIAAMTRALDKPGLSDYMYEIFYNSIFSSLKTHIVNATGNMSTNIYSQIENLPGAFVNEGMTGVKAVLSRNRAFLDIFKKQKVPKEAFAPDQFVGQYASAAELLASIKRAWMYGNSSFLDSVPEKQHNKVFGGKTGAVLNVPLNTIAAVDELFSQVAVRQGLYEQAYLDYAIAKKTNPELNYEQFTSNWFDNIPPEAYKKAVDFAAEITFKQQMGPVGRGVQQAVTNIPGGRLIVPVIRTPANLINFSFKRIPGFNLMFKQSRDALFGKDVKARNAEIGKLTVSSTLLTAGIMAAAEGKITGGPAAKREQRAVEDAAGFQPYSIKVGDTLLSYVRGDPFGIMLGTSVDLYRLFDYATKTGNTEDIELANEIFLAAVTSVQQNLVEKSYLQGVSGFSEFLANPQMNAKQFVSGLATAFVPNIVADINNSIDPTRRITQGPAEAFMLKAGIGRDNELTKMLNMQPLPPQRDITGKIKTREGGPAAMMLLPSNIKTLNQDDPHQAVAQEMYRLGMTTQLPSKVLSTLFSPDIKLTPAQQDTRNKLQVVFTDYVNTLINSEGYKKLNGKDYGPAVQKKLLEDLRSQLSKKLSDLVIAKHPELARDKAERELRGLTNPVMPQISPAIKEEIDKRNASK